MPATPGKRILRVSLSSLYWKICCVFIGAVMILTGLGTWSLFQHYNISRLAHNLEMENESANQAIEEQRQEIEFLTQRLREIQEKAAFVQKFLGMETQDVGEGKMGQGGLEVSPRFFPPELPVKGAVKPMSLEHPGKSGCLSRQEVGNIYASLDMIVRTLEVRQEELEHTPSISPVDAENAWISSPFGMRTSPFTGKKQFHMGIDIAGWKGTPIIATANGKVAFVGKNGLLGLTVKIRHNSTYSTEYGHLLKTVVKKGQYVKRGEIIGHMGDSGRSTGYHVHYGIKKKRKHINPYSCMMDWDKG
jgi:murein DD-endopeptidase MepM/ murein hydrolase activator NlpD